MGDTAPVTSIALSLLMDLARAAHVAAHKETHRPLSAHQHALTISQETDSEHNGWGKNCTRYCEWRHHKRRCNDNKGQTMKVQEELYRSQSKIKPVDRRPPLLS